MGAKSGKGGSTVIPMMYRDASNYKAHGQIYLDGELPPSQVAELKKLLDDGLRCIPEQLGLEHLGILEWGGLRDDDDHGWHELCLDERGKATAFRIEADEVLMGERSQHGGTVNEFIEKVRQAAAAGWKTEA